MTTVNTEGLDKAELLAALYNDARIQGAGIIAYRPGDMTKETAQRELNYCSDFDYLHGRVMKVDLSTDEPTTDLYNLYNGFRAFERIVEGLREAAKS